MFKKRKNKAPSVRLRYIDGKYYIENFIPVEVINDFTATGIRLITVRRVGSKNRRSFDVIMRDRNKRLTYKRGLRGKILLKDTERRSYGRISD